MKKLVIFTLAMVFVVSGMAFAFVDETRALC